MKTTQKTLVQLIEEKINLQDNLISLKGRISAMPYASEIEAIYNSRPIVDFDQFRASDMLAVILKDRDYPMTFDMLQEVFESSGFPYNEGHIIDCNPDTHESVERQAKVYSE